MIVDKLCVNKCEYFITMLDFLEKLNNSNWVKVKHLNKQIVKKDI